MKGRSISTSQSNFFHSGIQIIRSPPYNTDQLLKYLLIGPGVERCLKAGSFSKPCGLSSEHIKTKNCDTLSNVTVNFFGDGWRFKWLNDGLDWRTFL
jgi:hypothetical protein